MHLDKLLPSTQPFILWLFNEKLQILQVLVDFERTYKMYLLEIFNIDQDLVDQ